jgi:hypothetical protein
MPNIILPKSLADQIRSEQEKEEAAHLAAARKAEHERQLAFIKADLIQKIPQITDEESRAAICRLCGDLLNRGNRRILLYDNVSWAEAAKLISDVLLGDGVQYELKT